MWGFQVDLRIAVSELVQDVQKLIEETNTVLGDKEIMEKVIIFLFFNLTKYFVN